MAVDWDTWQRQMRQGGFGATDIPGLPSGASGGPRMAWAGWELGQPGQMTGTAYTAPGAATPAALPPVWATNAGTAAGSPLGSDTPALPDGWQQLPASAFPNGGWSYQTISEGDPADTTGPQTKNPDGSTQHGGTPITPAPAPASPTPEQSRDAGLAAIYGPATAAAGAADPVTGQNWQANATWKPPMLNADQWRDIAANGVRRGWGLQDATQNGGLTFSGSNYGFIMPTDYDYEADNHTSYVAGGGDESSLQRAIRWTADEMAGNPNLNPMQVMAKNIRRVDQEARAAGKNSGFNMDKLGGQGTGWWAGQPLGGATPGTGGTPGAPAAPGGTAVSVPGLDPTAGGGQGGVVPGQTPGTASSTKYNLLLQQDKAARMAALMDRLGLGDPMAQRSVFGRAVGGAASSLLDPWMQTQGMTGGNVADNFSSLMDKFTGYLNGTGGMGAIAGDASNAAQAAMGSQAVGALEDPEQIAMLNAFSELASSTMNPWLQRAYGNLREDAVGGFYNKIQQAAKAGQDPASIRFLPWLKDNPLYGFLTGQK